jgi:hypothetical protein
MSAENDAPEEGATNDVPLTWKELFEAVPPMVSKRIRDFVESNYAFEDVIGLPQIQLHCENERCGGVREFSTAIVRGEPRSEGRMHFITYTCRNCGRTRKTFAIFEALADKELNLGSAFKLGEIPAFGPPLPARVQRLVQPDRELFLKGYRCERQGLGIAAFAYYRRVVEDNKDRLLSEILRVAQRLGASPDLVKDIARAKSEIQFTRAIDGIRAAIPPALLISGQNPLTLLHSALSVGVHALSDDECLTLATSVRLVLTEFAERVAQALKDDVELEQAVARLQRK